jgi:hypothetical protein
MNAWKIAIALVTRFQWRTDAEETAPSRAFALIPVVGGLLGLLLAASAELLLWLAHRGAGTLLGAVVVFALWWWLTDGRGVRSSIALAESLFADRQDQPGALYCRVTLFQAMLLVRLICIGILLFLGRSLWLVAVTSLAAATLVDRLRAARLPDPAESKDWSSLYAHWIPAAIIALVAAAFCQAFVAGAFALVVAWLLPATLDRLLKQPPAPEAMPTHGSALAEGLLLVLGVIFFLAS